MLSAGTSSHTIQDDSHDLDIGAPEIVQDSLENRPVGATGLYHENHTRNEVANEYCLRNAREGRRVDQDDGLVRKPVVTEELRQSSCDDVGRVLIGLTGRDDGEILPHHLSQPGTKPS